ncbi:MAG TPA: hypothetical protein VLJ86_02240 [Ramlibacter sp.]|nr:hypothetical protein [Ramlibacter sp.]
MYSIVVLLWGGPGAGRPMGGGTGIVPPEMVMRKTGADRQGWRNNLRPGAGLLDGPARGLRVFLVLQEQRE